MSQTRCANTETIVATRCERHGEGRRLSFQIERREKEDDEAANEKWDWPLTGSKREFGFSSFQLSFFFL